MTNFINSISESVIAVEQALQSQFKIRPIKKENLGILNSIILASGIISAILVMTNIVPYNPIILSIELCFVSIIFLISTWFTKNQYIHTIITFLTSLSLFTWLNSVSQRWSTIVFSLALLVILLFIIYFDLLKKNIVLQLTGVAVLFTHFNRDIATNLFVFQDLKANQINELGSMLLPTFTSLILFLPILYFAITIARRTNRIMFSKVMIPVFHILTILVLSIITLQGPTYLGIIVLIAILIAASLLALKNHFNISFIYFLIFFALCFVLIINNYNLGISLPVTVAVIIFPLITLLTILAKYLIDKSFIDQK
jgi:hypothetical protein